METHLRSIQISSDTAGQLHVFRHDCHTFGVNGAQVRIFEQRDQVCLRRLLQSQDGRTLEAKVVLEDVGDFANQPLERQFAQQELRAFLVFANLAESQGARPSTRKKHKGLLRLTQMAYR